MDRRGEGRQALTCSSRRLMRPRMQRRVRARGMKKPCESRPSNSLRTPRSPHTTPPGSALEVESLRSRRKARWKASQRIAPFALHRRSRCQMQAALPPPPPHRINDNAPWLHSWKPVTPGEGVLYSWKGDLLSLHRSNGGRLPARLMGHCVPWAYRAAGSRLLDTRVSTDCIHCHASLRAWTSCASATEGAGGVEGAACRVKECRTSSTGAEV